MEFDMSVPLPSTRTIEQIEGEIIVLRDQVARNSIEIGKKLIEARNMVPKGSWQAWVENNIQFSYRTAARLMQLAEKFGDVPALAGVEATKVYALMALPDDQVEDFVAEHDLAAMTSREVQEAVKAQRAAEARANQLQMALEEAEAKVQEVSAAARQEAEEARKSIHEALTAKSEALKKLKEAERKLKEVEASGGEAAEAARRQVAEAEEKIRRLEEKANNGGSIPEEVAAELERLRKIEQVAPSAEIIRLRDGYERLIREFDTVLALLGEAAAVDAAKGRKYAAAIRKALDKMAGRLDDMAAESQSA